MINCPDCGKEIMKPANKWKYGVFVVEAYSCDKCGARFNEYIKNGKHNFTLKFKKGRGYKKV